MLSKINKLKTGILAGFLLTIGQQLISSPALALPVPKEARETARDMQFNPGRYHEYNNGTTPKLPKVGKGEHYIEGDVTIGQAQGRGQYRVVCLLNNKNKVIKKYYSPDHYGTGDHAGTRPTWIEFQ